MYLRWDHIKPYSNFETSNVIFDINGDSASYLDLAQTQLVVSFKVKHGGVHISAAELATLTGTIPNPTYLAPPPGEDNRNQDQKSLTATGVIYLGFANNMLHSLFKQVQVKISNTEVENTNSLYSYRAFIENLLCYDSEAKDTFLQNEGWVTDTAGQFENLALNGATANKGLLKRRQMYVDQAGTITCKGKIKSDIFNINRYMLPSVNIQVILSRSDPNFFLMALGLPTNQLSVEIENCYLQVRRVNVSDSMAVNHALQLEKTSAKYPIKRVIMRQINCPNASSFTLNNIHRGIMPSRVVLGFVLTDAFNGKIEKNPFNFQKMNVKSLKLKCASIALPYTEGIRLDWGTNRYIEAYDTIFQNIRNMGCQLSYDDYKGGNTLYAFDLTPDLCSAEHFNLLKGILATLFIVKKLLKLKKMLKM